MQIARALLEEESSVTDTLSTTHLSRVTLGSRGIYLETRQSWMHPITNNKESFDGFVRELAFAKRRCKRFL